MISADLSTSSKQSVGQRIAANTGLMVGSKFLAALLGIGSLSIATKSLDGWAFGTLVFLHAYMLFFSELGTFQSWQSIIRFGSDDIKNQDSQKLGRLLNFSIKVDAIAALMGYIMAMAIFGLVVLLGAQFSALNIGGPDQASGNLGGGLALGDVQKYAAVYCLLILLRQRGTSTGVFRLFDKFSVLAVKALIMPVVRFIGAIIAALNGAGFEGFLLAWFMGSFVAYIFLPVMGILELRKRGLWPDILKAKVNFLRPRKALWSFMIKSNIDSTLAASSLHLPALLVAAVFGPVWVGVYKIAEEFAKLLSEGFKLLDQVIYPELAKLVSAGEADKIWRLVTRAAAILLSFGVFMAGIFLWVGPDLLALLTTKDYAPAVPLASLLVPAAALMGTAAPLYPIFYAADKPHRAIYARGAGVLIYIISFFILSFTIGKMAPGWAAIFANASAVLLVIFMARHTMRSKVMSQNMSMPLEAKQDPDNDPLTDQEPVQKSVRPKVRFISDSDIKIWGLLLPEWQMRAMKKAGADLVSVNDTTPDDTGDPDIVLDVNWVLSSGLAAAFVSAPKTALVSEGKIIATHGLDMAAARTVIGRNAQDRSVEGILAGAGLIIRSPSDLAGSYNKTLRKTEAPYALDTSRVPIANIMKRQFASSYKGITDFVTKFIWPVPAYYVTRLCANLRITPNMVTTIGLVLMFAAMYYFYHGQWALGFVTGWIMTFLDTVDGKLARTTMTYSAWGNIYDHGIDLIHPPFWYTAWFFGLGGVLNWPELMTMALVAIWVGYVFDRIIEGIFIAQHGFHIHVWRPVNSFMRFITARRNPNVFIFMIGIILSAFWPSAAIGGFYAVAIWTWFCILFNIGVIIVSNLTRKPVKSWMENH